MEDDSFAARMEIKNLNKLQLYSASTPNGIKVAAMLEEIVDFRSATGDGFDYEPHTIDLRHQETRRIDFKQLNPNGKIPVIVDPHGPGSRDIVVFESGAILMYLAEKYGVLLAPLNTSLRYDTMKWFMWGSTGVSSQFKLFGYYYKYCKHNMPFCIARYEKECKRLLSVLEHHLNSHGHDWIVGGVYTIADIVVWPWLHALHENFDNAVRDNFDNLKSFPQVRSWYHRCLNRPATKRSLDVTRMEF